MHRTCYDPCLSSFRISLNLSAICIVSSLMYRSQFFLLFLPPVRLIWCSLLGSVTFSVSYIKVTCPLNEASSNCNSLSLTSLALPESFLRSSMTFQGRLSSLFFKSASTDLFSSLDAAGSCFLSSFFTHRLGNVLPSIVSRARNMHRDGLPSNKESFCPLFLQARAINFAQCLPDTKLHA